MHPNKKEKIIVYKYFTIVILVLKNTKTLLAYLLKTIISQPFYDKLRTKEQLGYLVNFELKL